VWAFYKVGNLQEGSTTTEQTHRVSVLLLRCCDNKGQKKWRKVC